MAIAERWAGKLVAYETQIWRRCFRFGLQQLSVWIQINHINNKNMAEPKHICLRTYRISFWIITCYFYTFFEASDDEIK